MLPPMPRIAVVIASGPDQAERAAEGLTIAAAMHHSGMLEAVTVLLTGPGVRCLERGVESLRDRVDALVEAGVVVAACTRSLAEHRLLDEPALTEGIRPVGAPTFLAAKAGEGFQFLSF